MSCTDCEPGSTRATPYPGPRCTSHHRARLKTRSATSHERAVQARYGLEPGDYQRLYQAQGGRCAANGCRATGASRRLAVDHDHNCPAGHPRNIGCRLCVRGLLCSIHNKQLGQNRDNPETFRSLAEYLEAPPARMVLQPKGPPIGAAEAKAWRDSVIARLDAAVLAA